MNDSLRCGECGTPLEASDPQPLCPTCIFRRLADTSSPFHQPKRGPGPPGLPTVESLQVPELSDGNDHDTDFYSEYELLGEVGRGGMGIVYRAHQPELNRIVALKVLQRAGLAGDAARKRFQSEVKVAGRLNHPHIVPVYDVGVMDGCPCFSMEYFPGGSLAGRLGQPGSDLPKEVQTLVKVARAVHFAHQHGVLHRDLKPGNILLDADGEPHVTDFGLAKELDSDTDLTRSGAVIGTPNYMSPEQATGKASSLSVATDIYSLGAVLYEILTGRPPFLAATPLETLRLVVEQEAPRPSTIDASRHMDRDVETVCLKALEKDPERRYATALELAEDLERWLRREPIHARPASNAERIRKWIQRHPALATMSAVLIVVLITGLALITWQWRAAEEARQRETAERRRAETALAHSAIALAESALREGNGPAAQAALATVPTSFRNGTWTYLLGESDTSRLLPPSIGLDSPNDLVANPARASEFAAADRAGRVVLFNASSGARLLEFEPGFERKSGNASLRLAFAKQGDRLAIGRTGRSGLVIHDARDGRKLLEWPAPRTGQLEFSPDGESLLQTSIDRETTHLWNAADGSRRWVLNSGYHAAGFGSSPDQVISYAWNEQLRLLNAHDATPAQGFAGSYFEKFAAQPGGNLLVAANPLGFVRGFDQGDGRLRFEFQPHESTISHLVFLPGGERFLTAATLPDGRQALQCWESRNGRVCETFNGGAGAIRALALHPISGELIVSGHELRLWQAATQPPLLVIHSKNAHPSAVFWGADDLLFAPMPDGPTSGSLVSLAGARPAVRWEPPESDYGQPSISADGRRAAVGRYNSAGRIAVLERAGGQINQIAWLSVRRDIAHVRLHPAGDYIAIVAADFATVDILPVPNAPPFPKLELANIKRVNDVAWLDGGKHLAGLVTTHAPRTRPGSTEQLVLWETATGRIVRSVTNASVTSIACASPDGRRFAEAGADRQVRIRDGTTLEIIREFRAHNAPLTALAWHPTRPILATAAQDLIIRLWNLDNSARVDELRGPLSPPSVLSFSPRGTRLATAARDGIARIWEPSSLAVPPGQNSR